MLSNSIDLFGKRGGGFTPSLFFRNPVSQTIVVIYLFFFGIPSYCAQIFTPGSIRFSLESYSRSRALVPIAVVEFECDSVGFQKFTPSEIISNDLDFSGRFSVLYLDKADTAHILEKNIVLVVSGRYDMYDDTINATFTLNDIEKEETLIQRTFSSSRKEYRSLSHRFSNIVFEHIFGEKGPFESKIAFVRDKGDVKELMVMDYDGMNMFQPFTTNVINMFPSFVNENTIVWTSYLRGKPDIYAGSVVSGAYRSLIVSKMSETSPGTNPATERIVYASSVGGSMDIYTADFDGRNRQQLTFDKAIDTAPDFSPSGYQIAFVSDRTGRPHIYVMDSEGSSVRRLTLDGSYYDSPAWSPKGNLIAYTARNEGVYSIWVIEPSGLNPRQVTTIPGSNEYPTWSPTGDHILFQSTLNYKTDLYCIRVDGTGLRKITGGAHAKMPDWFRY